MASGLKAAAGACLDFFYPPACLSCGRNVDSSAAILCDTCSSGLVSLPEQGCPRCGSPSVLVEEQCACCGRLAAELEVVRSAAWFMGPVPELIHHFKYQGFYSVASFLARFMAALPWAGELTGSADILVPVPLHWWRELRRGYNQSERLGQSLSLLCGKKLVRGAIVRSRRTKSQTRLNIEQRKANVAGAFLVKIPSLVAGRSILLVDDVMTTGTTLSECAVALKKAGARRIMAFTFARA